MNNEAEVLQAAMQMVKRRKRDKTPMARYQPTSTEDALAYRAELERNGARSLEFQQALTYRMRRFFRSFSLTMSGLLSERFADPPTDYQRALIAHYRREFLEFDHDFRQSLRRECTEFAQRLYPQIQQLHLDAFWREDERIGLTRFVPVKRDSYYCIEGDGTWAAVSVRRLVELVRTEATDRFLILTSKVAEHQTVERTLVRQANLGWVEHEALKMRLCAVFRLIGQ